MNYLEGIARKFNETRNDGPAADLAISIAEQADVITEGYTKTSVPDLNLNQMKQVPTVSRSDIEAAKNEDYRSTLNNNKYEDEEGLVYFVEGKGKYDILNNKNGSKQQETEQNAQVTQGTVPTQQAKEEDRER